MMSISTKCASIVAIVLGLQFSSASCNVVECDDVTNGWLHCKDDPKRCVSDAALCDGVRDCNDATDEVAYGWAPKGQCHPGKLTSYTCPEAYFKCHTSQNTGCLSNELLCDGVEHCMDHSDETNCPDVNFQLSSSTVLGVFIFALLIFTVTLCIAVLGVYATNKARGRRRRAAQRQEERRSRLRSVFAISGTSDRGNNGATESDGDGVDNPNYEGEPNPDLVSPPPYALVVEAELLEQERRRQDPNYRPVSTISTASSMAKPPSYEDIFGDVSLSLDPSREETSRGLRSGLDVAGTSSAPTISSFSVVPNSSTSVPTCPATSASAAPNGAPSTSTPALILPTASALILPTAPALIPTAPALILPTASTSADTSSLSHVLPSGAAFTSPVSAPSTFISADASTPSTSAAPNTISSSVATTSSESSSFECVDAVSSDVAEDGASTETSDALAPDVPPLMSPVVILESTDEDRNASVDEGNVATASDVSPDINFASSLHSDPPPPYEQ